MSINTEHQNPTQATATSTTSDPKGKCKEKEADPPTTEHVSDGEESGEDTWADYPFERFPSPPGDESRNARVPNAATSLTTPLDPPLMAFTYPPPPPLANDPTWYAQMVAEVHRHRAHVNTELELARTEAAEALADATLAELELKAEREEMQNFLNRLASVAGKNFVRKLIRGVVEALEPGDDNLDDEEQQDADDEDSNASDEGEVDQQDAGDEHLRSGASENEEGPQDAEDEEYNRSDNASSRCVPNLNLPQLLVSNLWFSGEGLSVHPRTAAQAARTALNSTSKSLSATAKPTLGT
ncbi:hypothetical protein EDB19DRAFT_1684835 [Suillus lakei]|nr:hypothetical protein EDB19DRAFT_1684835 [Suillus lakei]